MDVHRINPRITLCCCQCSVTEDRPFLHATTVSDSDWPAAGSTGTWRGSGGSLPWSRGSASTAAPTEDAKQRRGAVKNDVEEPDLPMVTKISPDLELLLSSYWVPLVALEGRVGLFDGHAVHRLHDLQRIGLCYLFD